MLHSARRVTAHQGEQFYRGKTHRIQRAKDDTPARAKGVAPANAADKFVIGLRRAQSSFIVAAAVGIRVRCCRFASRSLESGASRLMSYTLQ